ncbi:MAG TPA: hypothetical protein VGL91_15775 [Acidobacteriota bacterium]
MRGMIGGYGSREDFHLDYLQTFNTDGTKDAKIAQRMALKLQV